MSASQAVVVDDADPRINYVTAWYHQGGQGTDYKQTVSVSGNPGAVFEFTFTGTSVSVFGSIPANDTAVSTYSIDLSTPVTFTYPNLTRYTSRQLLYQSDTLPYGSHTLTVVAPDSVIGLPWTPLWFDYLTYIPSPPSESTSTTSPTPSSQNNVSPQQVTVTVQAQGAVSSANTGHSASSSSAASILHETISSHATTSSLDATSLLSTSGTTISSFNSLSLQPSPSVSPSATSASGTPPLGGIIASSSSPSPSGSALSKSQSTSSSKSSNLKIILPVVLTLCLILIMALILWWMLRRRRQRRSVSLQRRATPFYGARRYSPPAPVAISLRPPVIALGRDDNELISPQSSTTWLISDPKLPNASAEKLPMSSPVTSSPSEPSTSRPSWVVPQNWRAQLFGRGSMAAISISAETAPPPYSL